MIPRILHRIWFGSKPIPQQYDFFWAEWARLHPGWEQVTWTEKELPPLINWKIYDEVELWGHSCGVPMSHERAVAVQRADVVCYEALYHFGGVYVNCDVRPLRSFEPLLEHAAFVGMEDDYHICNAVMGAERRHRLMGQAITQMPARWTQYRHVGMEVATGPQHLTAVWRSGSYDVTVLPREAFYPVHFSGMPWGVDSSAAAFEQAVDTDAYAVHSWGHRWQEGDTIP